MPVDGSTRPPVDWGRAKAIFADALDQPRDERRAFVERGCDGDAGLFALVERLIRSHDSATDFLYEVPGAPRATAARPPDAAPERIGPYVIHETVGEGGFGRVYRAEQHEPIEREVAIKVLKPGIDSERVLERFQAERDLLAKLDHPGIARILDAGATADGRPFVAMEMIRGASIVDYCRAHDLGVDDRVALVRDVCRAIHHAHQRAVLHRDLKPSNILVTDEHGTPTPRVIDFGIAKAMDVDPNEGRTLERDIVGTPKYMAPEQLIGDRSPDIRTDVFALGVLLCEVLTGSGPRDATTMTARPPRETTARRPSDLVGSMPQPGVPAARSLRGDLDRIVLKCVEWDTDRRYDSAAALGDDLDRFLEGLPVLAVPSGVVYRVGKLVRRHALASSLAVIAALAVVAGSAGLVIGIARANQQRDLAQDAQDEAERQARRSEFVSRFLLEDMLHAVDPDVSQGREITVREVFTTAAERLRQRDDLDAETQYSTLFMIGNVFDGIGSHDDAIAAFDRAAEVADSYLDAPNRKSIEARIRKVDVVTQNGMRFERAYFDQLLLDAESLVPPDERLVRSVRQRITGDHEILAAIVAEYEADLDADSTEYFNAMLAYASALAFTYDYDAMLEARRRAYELALRLYGPDHTTTFGSLGAYATLRSHRHRDEETLELMRQVYEPARRILGDEHPTTIATMRAYGVLLGHTGRTEEAEAMLLRAAQAAAARFGEGGIRHTSGLGALAQFYISVGRHAEALAILEAIKAPRAAQWSASHVVNLRSHNDLAACYLALGVPEKALAEAEAALAVAPTDASRRPEAHLMHGRALLALGRPREASEAAQACEAAMLANLVPDEPLMRETAERLAALFGALGDDESAAAIRARIRARIGGAAG